MKLITSSIIFIIVLLLLFQIIVAKNLSKFSKSIYDYSAKSIDGKLISLSNYKGKKILIVNVASKCGYTYQYEGLEKLQKQFPDKLVVLGFPANNFLFQEPGSNQKIKTFCRTQFGITFQLFEKISVRGWNMHDIYVWLTNKELNGWNDQKPSWNFNKYLLDEQGQLIKYFNASVKPLSTELVDLIKN